MTSHPSASQRPSLSLPHPPHPPPPPPLPPPPPPTPLPPPPPPLTHPPLATPQAPAAARWRWRGPSYHPRGVPAMTMGIRVLLLRV